MPVANRLATGKVIASITEVEGTPCTVFAHAAFARCTEADDSEELKRLVRTRLHDAKPL